MRKRTSDSHALDLMLPGLTKGVIMVKEKVKKDVELDAKVESEEVDSTLSVKKIADENTELIADCVDVLKFHRDRLDAIELRLSKVSDRLGFDKEL